MTVLSFTGCWKLADDQHLTRLAGRYWEPRSGAIPAGPRVSGRLGSEAPGAIGTATDCLPSGAI